VLQTLQLLFLVPFQAYVLVFIILLEPGIALSDRKECTVIV
jgi:hypothetical protein